MPLEISEFRVVPDTGDGPLTVTLHWAVQDATAVILSDVGTVDAKGSVPCTVDETTTFVLTAFDARCRQIVCDACRVTVAADPERTVVPKGLIVPWWSETAEPPTGWAVCDGKNGTPDLQDRFIRGAGPDGPDPGDRGEADPHTHDLELASGTEIGHSTPGEGAHRHDGPGAWRKVGVERAGGSPLHAAEVDDRARWGDAGGHSHPIVVTAPQRLQSAVDDTAPVTPRPRWRALFYLMKL